MIFPLALAVPLVKQQHEDLISLQRPDSWTFRSDTRTTTFDISPLTTNLAYNIETAARRDRGSYAKMSDIEKMIGGDYAQLTNTNIRSFGWKGVSVTVKDRQSQQPKAILSDVHGIVKAGELLALMGPS